MEPKDSKQTAHRVSLADEAKDPRPSAEIFAVNRRTGALLMP